MTAKPIIYVFNVDEAVLTDAARKAALEALVAPAHAVFLDAKLESELIDLDDADAAELLASTGQTESGLDQLARIGFDTLGLQTYLTAGPKEARAWTIGKGWKAPQAAGVIHTDFERGFIKAEIISLRRPRRDRLDRRGPREGQGPHRGQGLRHARRRRRGVPLQRLGVNVSVADSVSNNLSMWAAQREQRRELGDVLTAPRPLDHVAYFRNAKSAAVAADAFEASGFAVSQKRSLFRVSLTATREEALDDENVEAFLRHVIAIVEGAGGTYDGFGGGVVT